MYGGNTSATISGWPSSHVNVMNQNTRLRHAMIGVPASNRVNRMKLSAPSERHASSGLRVCTSHDCRYPLYQRDRCRIQLIGSLLASSIVVESNTAVE